MYKYLCEINGANWGKSKQAVSNNGTEQQSDTRDHAPSYQMKAPLRRLKTSGCYKETESYNTSHDRESFRPSKA